MSKTTYPGIDYGLGRSNVDLATGIRYGVIAQNKLGSWFFDDMEPVYIARCPECYSEIPEAQITGEYELTCSDCEKQFNEDNMYGDSPDSWTLDAGPGYQVELTETEVFIIKSPVAIMAQYCSPCVPGAGNLESPCDNGALTYAVPLNWFDSDNPAPYSQEDLIDLA